jgi:hypothetical protein
MKSKREKAKTTQFNIRIPVWLLEELSILAEYKHRNVSEMAKLLLRDAVFAARGWCVCAIKQEGYGKSGMACWEHGDNSKVLREL